jgi:tripartite-type tricarboxylate transporter receptor subunit TctC
MMTFSRRNFLQLAAGAATLPALPRLARAQGYPTRPVTLVVPFAPGAGTDAVARIMGRWLSPRLGQTVVVENKPGAGTILATQSVVNAPTDGHTVLFVSTSSATNPTFYPTLPYNFLRDIVPVSGLVTGPFVMVVNPSLPAKNVAEFIAYAKANPGKVSMASTGAGTAVHLSGELFKVMTGVDMVHVPYRGGAPAITDLISGQVQVLFSDVPGALPHIRSGALRPLAVTTASRSAFLPDVPAISETVAGYASSTWYGTGVPKGTPPEIVERLSREINAGLADQAVKTQLTDLGVTPLVFTPAEFRTHIEAETEKWGKVIRAANIKAE